MGWRDFEKPASPAAISPLPSSPWEAAYYRALADFESFRWLDNEPDQEVVDREYPKLQAALKRVSALYWELRAAGILPPVKIIK